MAYGQHYSCHVTPSTQDMQPVDKNWPTSSARYHKRPLVTTNDRSLPQTTGNTTRQHSATHLDLSVSSILVGSITRQARLCAWMVRSAELSWTTYDQMRLSGSSPPDACCACCARCPDPAPDPAVAAPAAGLPAAGQHDNRNDHQRIRHNHQLSLYSFFFTLLLLLSLLKFSYFFMCYHFTCYFFYLLFFYFTCYFVLYFFFFTSHLTLVVILSLYITYLFTPH